MLVMGCWSALRTGCKHLQNVVCFMLSFKCEKFKIGSFNDENHM